MNIKLQMHTDHPLATGKDTTEPKGARNDNTANERFVDAMIRVKEKVRYCDLGCSGGWFVRRTIEKGHIAAGIDGSDYSKEHRRAEWATVPDNLFTADITKPYSFTSEGQKFTFNIMSAFDVMEHLPEESLPGFFDNLRNNLEKGGYFVCSIADFPDEGYHVTLKPLEWWVNLFKENGFEPEPIIEAGEYGRLSSFNLTFKHV